MREAERAADARSLSTRRGLVDGEEAQVLHRAAGDLELGTGLRRPANWSGEMSVTMS